VNGETVRDFLLDSLVDGPLRLHPRARLLPPDVVAEPEPSLLELLALSEGLTDDEVETAWQMSRCGVDELEALRLVREARTPCPEPPAARACAIPLERVRSAAAHPTTAERQGTGA
jgi:hypothetical protein